MNSNERSFITALLSEGKSVEDAAEALVMKRAIAEVERVANDIAYSEAHNRWVLGLRFVTLYSPQPEPVLVGKEKGVEMWQTPARQEYKVKVLDLPAFAQEMKLNLRDLQAVTEGKRRDVKGFICIPSGATMDVGEAWTDPNPERIGREARQAAEAKEAQNPRKVKSAYTPSAPVIEWTPKR
jgi:hypothetical protein